MSDAVCLIVLIARAVTVIAGLLLAVVILNHFLVLTRTIRQVTHGNQVTFVAISPDGKYIVTGGMDGTVRVLETFTGREVARMTHADSVTSVAFSPDGRHVASGSYRDPAIHIWEAATGKEIAHIISGDIEG